MIVEDITTNGVAHKTAKAELTAGEHPIKIEFFQKGGGAACILSWQTPGGPREVIPASAFSHDPSAEKIDWDQKAWAKFHSPGGGPNGWDNLDYGPFLSASILAPAPAGNMTYKGVAVKLGKVKVDGEEQDASVCFDTQLMRMSAGWVGGFLHLENVAFTGTHGPCPAVAGEQIFGTRNAPGWAQKDGSFTDPRIALHGEPFGGMPRDYLHYKGLYRCGDKVVFSYSVNGMDVLESPAIFEWNKAAHFIRDFRVGPSKMAQTMVIADVEADASANVKPVQGVPEMISWHEIGNGMTIGARLLRGSHGHMKSVLSTDGKHWKIVVTIEPHDSSESFQITMGKLVPNPLPRATELMWIQPNSYDFLTHGGPARWPHELPAIGKLQVEPTTEADKAAYVLDEIGVPEIPSNWPRLLWRV